MEGLARPSLLISLPAIFHSWSLNEQKCFRISDFDRSNWWTTSDLSGQSLPLRWDRNKSALHCWEGVPHETHWITHLTNTFCLPHLPISSWVSSTFTRVRRMWLGPFKICILRPERKKKIPLFPGKHPSDFIYIPLFAMFYSISYDCIHWANEIHLITFYGVINMMPSPFPNVM